MTKEEFNLLIDSYKKLDKEEKLKEIINSLKEDIVIFDAINKLVNSNSELLFNKEIMDLNKETTTVEDYYEAIYVYLKILEDASGKVLNTIADI